MIEKIVDIMEKAVENIPLYEEKANRELLLNTLREFREHEGKQGFLGVDKDGEPVSLLLAQVITNHPFIEGRVAAEIGWFSTGRAVNNLLKEFEQWAEEEGCNTVVISCFKDEVGQRLDKVYKRQGYEQVEITYAKTLQKEE